MLDHASCLIDVDDPITEHNIWFAIDMQNITTDLHNIQRSTSSLNKSQKNDIIETILKNKNKLHHYTNQIEDDMKKCTNSTMIEESNEFLKNFIFLNNKFQDVENYLKI